MRLTRKQVLSFLPKRPLRSHKGTFGRVLVIAGSEKMAGAGVLCTRAILQTGAGLAALALPKSRQSTAAAALPEMLTLPLAEKDGVLSVRAVKQVQQFIKNFKPSLILIGPGLAQAPFILPFLEKNTLPAVVDADALNALARSRMGIQKICGRFPLICTPHPGEMQRLLGQKISADDSKRPLYAKELSARTGGVSVLKGYHTVVTDGEKVYVNTTGGPALAKAGSGDTLAGFIAGLWAQLGTAAGFNNASALKAAACGVYLHGLCGDLAAAQLTPRCVLASDVAAQLPRAFKRLERAAGTVSKCRLKPGKGRMSVHGKKDIL